MKNDGVNNIGMLFCTRLSSNRDGTGRGGRLEDKSSLSTNPRHRSVNQNTFKWRPWAMSSQGGQIYSFWWQRGDPLRCRDFPQNPQTHLLWTDGVSDRCWGCADDSIFLSSLRRMPAASGAWRLAGSLRGGCSASHPYVLFQLRPLPCGSHISALS